MKSYIIVDESIKYNDSTIKNQSPEQLGGWKNFKEIFMISALTGDGVDRLQVFSYYVYYLYMMITIYNIKSSKYHVAFLIKYFSTGLPSFASKTWQLAIQYGAIDVALTYAIC